jgi:hypothetical protein
VCNYGGVIVFDLSTPESTLLIINGIALTLTQAIKTLAGLDDRYAQLLAFAVGGLLGVGWFAAWNAELIDPGNTALLILGYALSAIGFALVPSGAYKFVMAAADRSGGQ